MELLLSSKKAAEYLSVNESTIKRWADSGYLKCLKTPGGHRKFNINDLNVLSLKNDSYDSKLKININGKDEKLNSNIASRNYPYLWKRLEKYLLNGDSGLALNFIYTLYFNNYALEEIFDEIISKSMRNIGLLWQNKKVDIESEHIATNTIISALYQFEKAISKKNKINKTVICAGFENEYHQIGLLSVKIYLETEGWNVIYPGINLPFKSLSQLILKHKPNLICISSNYNYNSESFEANITKLKNTIKNSECKVLIGGEISLSPGFSDIKCKNISELKKQINQNLI